MNEHAMRNQPGTWIVIARRTVKTRAGNVIIAKGERTYARHEAGQDRAYVTCETPNHYAGCYLSSIAVSDLVKVGEVVEVEASR